jgi:transcriptional regulator with XRE-family HTH domain
VADPTIRRLLTRLRQLRKIHNLTQEQFSELSGIGYKYYQAIEEGRKPDLRLSTLERLARAYGVEVHSLLAPEMPRTKVRGKTSIRKSSQSR